MEYNLLEHGRIQHSANDSSGMPCEEGAVWEGFLGTTGLERWVGQKQAVIGTSGRHRQFAALLGGWRCGRVGKCMPSPRLLKSKCQLSHKSSAAKSQATLILCHARSEGYRPASSTVGCWSRCLCAGPSLTPSRGSWDLCLVVHKVTSIL